MKAPFSPIVKKALKSQEDVKKFFEAVSKTDKGTVEVTIGGIKMRIREVR